MRIIFESSLLRLEVNISNSGFTNPANWEFDEVLPGLRKLPYQDSACLRLARARLRWVSCTFLDTGAILDFRF